MASYDQHIARVKSNLIHLERLNKQIKDSIDWQVTTCFYVSVHLMNAYLAKCSDLHYKTHSEVDQALNPEGICPFKLNAKEYLAYEKLKNLSRRSRYMCHDEPSGDNKHGYLTDHKHLAKAIKNMDHLLKHFGDMYKIDFQPIEITCNNFSASDKFNFVINPFAPKKAQAQINIPPTP